MSPAASLFAFLSRNSAYVLFGGGLLGLALPDLATDLRPLLPASVAGMLVLAVVRISLREIRAQVSRPGLLAATCGWLLIGCPIVAFGVVSLLPMPAGLAVAIILMAALPPLFSTPAMALLLGLHPSLALAIVIVSMLIGPYTLVAVTAGLLGLELGIEPLALMLRLGALVLGCIAAGALLRTVAGSIRIERASNLLDTVLLILLTLFAIAIMDGVVDRFAAEPGHVFLFVGVSFLANLALQALGAAAFIPLGRRRALTVGFASGNRSMGLLLAVLPGNAAADTVLYFAVGQLPIYMLPALLAPVYRRFVGNDPD